MRKCFGTQSVLTARIGKQEKDLSMLLALLLTISSQGTFSRTSENSRITVSLKVAYTVTF